MHHITRFNFWVNCSARQVRTQSSYFSSKTVKKRLQTPKIPSSLLFYIVCGNAAENWLQVTFSILRKKKKKKNLLGRNLYFEKSQKPMKTSYIYRGTCVPSQIANPWALAQLYCVCLIEKQIKLVRKVKQS